MRTLVRRDDGHQAQERNIGERHLRHGVRTALVNGDTAGLTKWVRRTVKHWPRANELGRLSRDVDNELHHRMRPQKMTLRAKGEHGRTEVWTPLDTQETRPGHTGFERPRQHLTHVDRSSRDCAAGEWWCIPTGEVLTTNGDERSVGRTDTPEDDADGE
jgi:hypothetical protein